MADPDPTVASFPTYAELTRTQGWRGSSPSPIGETLDDAVAAMAQSTSATRYSERAVLGAGGMGKVLLARDARIGRDVALKVLHDDRELAPDERARFLREAQVQGQLEHPSIVPVYDIDRRPDGTMFFTMRRVVGRTLHEILDELFAGKSSLTQRELLQAFATVCLTIDYAHSRGVVHRDLKPANIMLGDFGEVYVLDWGLARMMDNAAAPAEAVPAPRLSIPGEMMGTPLYMAPEQMGNPDVGAAADVYALGAILFELLTFERVRDPRALFAPVDARPSTRTPQRGVAPELETICVRATEHDPADRYPSARALQEAVAKYLEGDRETEQRRTLAAVHAKAARAALSRAVQPGASFEGERGTAMRELGRALAFDPSNGEHVAMLAEIMATPPQRTPPEVATQVRTSGQDMIRTGARYSTISSALWFLAIPLAFAMGILQGYQLALVLVPVTIAAALSAIALGRTAISATLQLSVVVAAMLATLGLTRLFGPLVLTPTLIATYAIVLQAHPVRVMRQATFALSCAVMILPVALELAGVLPASYRFGADGILIVPQMLALPGGGSIIILLGGSLAMMVVPCIFIGKLRSALADAQRQQLTQAWHFRRLGDELMGARR